MSSYVNELNQSSISIKLQTVENENEYSSIINSSSSSLCSDYNNYNDNEYSVNNLQHQQQSQSQDLNNTISNIEQIIVNVGGTKFYTTKATLVNEKYSYFDILFSGHFNMNSIRSEKPGKPKTFFVDRDASHFRIILNYLRGDTTNIPTCEKIRSELYTEADFYCLNGLKELIYPYHFYQSKILTFELSNDLIKLIKSRIHIKKANLLFRASEHNFESKRFHEHCDFKGSTITIIRSGDNVFGGYTSRNWSLSTQYLGDNNLFLFDLANLPPSIIKKEENSPNQSIYSNSLYGPVFGLLGKNLTISNNCNVNKLSYFESYYDSKGKGKRIFKVDEYEVFKVDC